VPHSSIAISARGNPLPGNSKGKIFDGVRLTGKGQYLDVGDQGGHCLGNLDFCRHGALISMWIKPNKLRDGMYLMSTGLNGITLRYQNRRLIATAMTTTRRWELSTALFTPGQWHYLEVNWHPMYGLALYLNLRLVDSTMSFESRDLALDFKIKPNLNQFYLGRGNVDMLGKRYADAVVDDVYYFFARREYLLAFDYIMRGERRSFFLICFQ
jgi:hypothetical protein